MKVRTGNNQDPTTLWKHLEEIIKTHIRPLLQDHGGDIVIREIRKKDVRVALLGNCKGCPAAQITIEQTVQRILSEQNGKQDRESHSGERNRSRYIRLCSSDSQPQ